MGFIRIKTIKGRKYAYLVENTWTTSGSRQKSKAYLGRVYQPEKLHSALLENHTLKKKGKSELIMELISLELQQHGFEKKGSSHCNNDCIVDLAKREVINNRGNVAAIAMNDGVLCSMTLQKALDAKVSNESKLGLDLAKSLVGAGLALPKDLFVDLYDKITE